MRLRNVLLQNESVVLCLLRTVRNVADYMTIFRLFPDSSRVEMRSRPLLAAEHLQSCSARECLQFTAVVARGGYSSLCVGSGHTTLRNSRCYPIHPIYKEETCQSEDPFASSILPAGFIWCHVFVGAASQFYYLCLANPRL